MQLCTGSSLGLLPVLLRCNLHRRCVSHLHLFKSNPKVEHRSANTHKEHILRCIHTGFVRMDESKPAVKQESEKHDATETPKKRTGFKWENRTRFSMLIMIGWSIGVAIYIIKRRLQRDEEHHKIMLEQSLRYMSDEERNKIVTELQEKGITGINTSRK